MARWSRHVTLWILPVLITAALLALAWNVHTPQRVRTELLSLCDLPCWGGLTPGQTDRDEIVPILMGSYSSLMVPSSLPGAPLVSFGGVIANEGISGVVEFSGREVYKIRLNTPVSLTHLFDALGAPDCVHLLPPVSLNIMDAIWLIDGRYVRTLLQPDARGRLTLNMPLQNLEIGVAGSDLCGEDAVPWLGFAPAWRYRSQISAINPTRRVVVLHSP